MMFHEVVCEIYFGTVYILFTHYTLEDAILMRHLRVYMVSMGGSCIMIVRSVT